MKFNRCLAFTLTILCCIVFNQSGNASSISPFSGLAIPNTGQSRPVMAIIDNFTFANPQAGLDKASIIYEFPVEGGITRFLALYYDFLPSRIGPIRSARTYLIDKAYEYNAVLLHAGSSPQGYELITFNEICTLDEFNHSYLYWREPTRKAPHNLYTGWPYLQSHLSELSSNNTVPRFPFLSLSIFADEGNLQGKEIGISFANNNQIDYKYLLWNGYYQRYVNGKLHFTDDGAPLKIDNIVVQFVESKVIDELGRLDISLMGSGKAIIFRDGQVIEGTWLKTSPGWTSYLDNQGRLISFNPGSTWVEVVPKNREVKYK